jgi:hypothetical protein
MNLVDRTIDHLGVEDARINLLDGDVQLVVINTLHRVESVKALSVHLIKQLNCQYFGPLFFSHENEFESISLWVDVTKLLVMLVGRIIR